MKDAKRLLYTVNFFNNNDVAYVTENAIFDFVECYKEKTPKSLSKSKRDTAIRVALQYVDEGILDDIKAAAGVKTIIRETE